VCIENALAEISFYGNPWFGARRKFSQNGGPLGFIGIPSLRGGKRKILAL